MRVRCPSLSPVWISLVSLLIMGLLAACGSEEGTGPERSTVHILVTTSIGSGTNVLVDGESVSAPATRTWEEGSEHRIGVPEYQHAGHPDSRYAFDRWSDGGAREHSISVPASSTTYTANLVDQHRMHTTVSPEAGGTITRAPDREWYDGGADVRLILERAGGCSITAWDGIAGSTTADTVAVTVSGPLQITANLVCGAVVSILAPADYTSVEEGEAIEFRGSAHDVEDGEVDPSALEWRSDIDGSLGIGETVEASNLSVATHWIILKATDSEGNSREDSVSILVRHRAEDVDRDITVEDSVAGYMIGQIIVNYNHDPPSNEVIAQINREYGLTSQLPVPGLDDFIATATADADSTLSLASGLSNDAQVQYAVVDILHTPLSFPDDYDSSETLQDHHALTGVDILWRELSDSGLRPGEGVRIAIIDTGLDTDHSDFGAAGKISDPAWYSCCGDPKTNLADVEDDEGHGTHVASIAAGGGWDGNQITGVAPAATIIPIKVTGTWLIRGIAIKRAVNYADSVGAHVINISTASDPTSLYELANQTLFGEAFRKVLDAGVHIVVASGNCGEDYDDVSALAQVDDRLWVVGGTDVSGSDIFQGIETGDCKGDAQSQGGGVLDFLAPGDSIWAANNDGFIDEGTGTSYATPIVSGLIALHLSAGVDPGQIPAVMTANTLDLGPDGWDSETGLGRVIAGIEITEVSPGSVRAGETTTVTVYGRNFDRRSKVLVDGIEAVPVAVSMDVLSFDVTPAGDVEWLDVRVRHPGGLESNGVSLIIEGGETTASWVALTQAPAGNDIYAAAADGSVYEMNFDFAFGATRPSISADNVVALDNNDLTGDLVALTADGRVYSRPDDGTTAWTLRFTLPAAEWVALTQAPGSNDIYAAAANGSVHEMNFDFAFGETRPSIPADNVVALDNNDLTGDLMALTAGGRVYTRPDDGTTAWTLRFTLPAAKWVALTQAPGSNDIYAAAADGSVHEMNFDFAFGETRPSIPGDNVVALDNNDLTGDLVALAADGRVYSRPDDSTTAWVLRFTIQ